MRHGKFHSCLLKSVIAAAVFLPSAIGQTGEYATQDLTLFGGGQSFDMLRSRPDHTFADGLIFGIRYTYDFHKYVGFEANGSWANNNLKLNTLQPYPIQSVGAGVRNYQASIGPVFHFTPRQSKVRPFIRVGVGATMYDPTEEAANMFRRPENAYLGVNRFNMKYGPAAFWGGGIKFNPSRRVGFRFDVGGMLSQTPHFMLPDYPRGVGTVYIPRSGTEHALNATAGLTFHWGFKSDAPPPPPPAPPPPPKPAEPPKAAPATVEVGSIAGIRAVCAGENLDLSVEASATPAGSPITYRWTINGTAFGENAAKVTLPTRGLGASNNVAVEVSSGGASKTATASLELKPSAPPTITLSGLPATVRHGETLALSANATASECCGPATISYTVSEGSVSGNTFNSTGVSFDMSNRSRRQTKVVRVTATATDRCGNTARAEGEITVVLSPQAQRLDDLIFPVNSSRVNNCAKRILLEVLTPMLRDNPGGNVVLIGHTDGRERAGTVDRARVLNSAAVISAGTGICPQLELSRVQGSWVGTKEGSTPRPGLCGSSAEIRERSGQAISASDTRAQYRRVEVWFVPEGAEVPAELQGIPAIPAAQVTPLGCPR